MAQIYFTSKSIPDLTPCEVHRHASGQFSIVINGYRFFLPECHSFDNVLEHLTILNEALDHGISFDADFLSSSLHPFDFYDPEKDFVTSSL